MTQGALAQHIRPLLQSCNTAIQGHFDSIKPVFWVTKREGITPPFQLDFSLLAHQNSNCLIPQDYLCSARHIELITDLCW